jgi:selenocysteine lyase/cysteine desulfurase
MSAAMTYLEDLGQSRVEERVRALGAELRESLGKVEGVQVLDRGDDLGGIVTFVGEGEEPSATQARLARSGVRMSTVVATSSLLAMQDRALSSASRASLHYYNTSEEIGRFCRLLGRA